MYRFHLATCRWLHDWKAPPDWAKHLLFQTCTAAMAKSGNCNSSLGKYYRVGHHVTNILSIRNGNIVTKALNWVYGREVMAHPVILNQSEIIESSEQKYFAQSVAIPCRIRLGHTRWGKDKAATIPGQSWKCDSLSSSLAQRHVCHLSETAHSRNVVSFNSFSNSVWILVSEK